MVFAGPAVELFCIVELSSSDLGFSVLWKDHRFNCSDSVVNWYTSELVRFIQHCYAGLDEICYLATFEGDFTGGRGYGFRYKSIVFVFSRSFRNSKLLKSHRKRAFQKELNLSFHNHQKLLKSVHKRKSYSGKCISL